ncbi:MAG: ureidoglycolate lyase [Robiginitomaculum sp.]|nr:ureidoglycolate lyase [Robiginitomaculum sp.]
MARTLTPIPLTSTNFAPFGDVVEAHGQNKSINYGQTKRYHDLAAIDTRAENGQTLVNIFRSTPLPLPTPSGKYPCGIKIEIMERHPLSSQMFMPLSGNPYLVVVAPKGQFDESKIKVFLASPDQGVNYHAGTWHHYSLALDGVSDFLVVDRGGATSDDKDNCDEVVLDEMIVMKL